jgi:CDP-diacylglycerol--glycerol-3-phosphate 3-phosphatidyltransferase
MGWANRLTIARGGLAVALWVLLGMVAAGREDHAELWWTAFALFVTAAGTDSLDGWIARRRNEVSVFGRIADPFVDKMLILGSLCFLLAIPGVPAIFPPWVAVVIVTRELLVTALRGMVEGSGKNFQAGVWGKSKMLLQCLAVGAVLLHGAGIEWLRAPFPDLTGTPAPGDVTWPWVVSVIAGVATAASGVEYTVRAVAAMRPDPDAPERRA